MILKKTTLDYQEIQFRKSMTSVNVTKWAIFDKFTVCLTKKAFKSKQKKLEKKQKKLKT